MNELPILSELPSGYFVEESPRGVLAMHIEVARGFHESGFGPDRDGSFRESDLSGRSKLLELELDGQRYVVRRFRHGGLLRWLTRSKFLDPERPFRELVVSHTVAQSGIRTPRVVAARARRQRLFGWSLDLVMRRVEDSRDVAELLEELRRGEHPPAVRHALFRAAGELIGEMAALGLRHADLNARNLLVENGPLEDGEPVLWVIDLDESSFLDGQEHREARAVLRRLYRSVERRELRGKPFLHRTDFARFLRAYAPSDGAWKREWRAVRELHQRTRRVHSIGWYLEKLFGGGPGVRDGKAVVRPD